MGLHFAFAENAYANGTHMPIVVSPWCISLWQVSWRRLAFSELQSIFNRVAPLPDGPAIYGPERGQAGNDWVHRVEETAAMTGWWTSVEQDEGVHYGEVERDERDLEIVEDRRAQGQPVFITLSACSLLTSCDRVRSTTWCSGYRLTWIWLVAFIN